MPVDDSMVQTLLTWYARNARDLPWRRTSDPYAIWIAEVMLQQTQVQTVIPYWERWMRELPDVTALARAKLDRILKLWEGLGYYTRVRNLHLAAQVIREKHGGVFPREYDAVLSLPGIGPYTAGAICSIAYDQPTAILDGNVIRVLTRVFAIGGNVRAKAVSTRLWNLSRSLVERAGLHGACSSLNQALMELGATVCRVVHPECQCCPLSSFCIACRTGRTHRFPNLGKRPRQLSRRVAAFLVCRNQRVFVRQRPRGVVNALLWEFPNTEVPSATNAIQELAAEHLGHPVSSAELLGTIRHTITRYRIRLDVFRVRIPDFAAGRYFANGRWCNRRQLGQLAFPSAHRQIVMMLCRNGDLVPDLSDGSYNRARTIQNRPLRERGQARRS